jgi:hypothetical protein
LAYTTISSQPGKKTYRSTYNHYSTINLDKENMGKDAYQAGKNTEWHIVKPAKSYPSSDATQPNPTTQKKATIYCCKHMNEEVYIWKA